MATPVEVPKLGNTVEECLIARWAKRKGDNVSAGELVAEIETDKATFEVVSPVEGTVLETFFAEGALVPVFTNLFVVGMPGEDPAPFRPGRSATVPLPDGRGSAETANAATTIANAPSGAATVRERQIDPQQGSRPLSPRARRFAEEHNFHAGHIVGSGPGGRVLEEDVRAAFFTGPPSHKAASTAPSRSRLRSDDAPVITTPVSPASPAAALASAAQALMTAAAALAAAPAPSFAAAPKKPTTLREKIAHRLLESMQTTAQYTLHTSANATALLALRARIKSTPGAPSISDLIAWCTVRTLQQFPALNSNAPEIHLGFAADTPRGLLVPVVRDAHTLSATDLAKRMKSLAQQTVEGKISPDDLSGATFTISNLGSLGIESFTPILTPPQVAILGVGAIQLKPVRRNEAVEFIDSLALSLTCDHQFIDGAPGARFLQALVAEIAAVESSCTIS